MLPGGSAGAVAYLAYVILGHFSSPAFEVHPAEAIVGAVLRLIVGSLIGSVIAAGVRAFRDTPSNPDTP